MDRPRPEPEERLLKIKVADEICYVGVPLGPGPHPEGSCRPLQCQSLTITAGNDMGHPRRPPIPVAVRDEEDSTCLPEDLHALN